MKSLIVLLFGAFFVSFALAELSTAHSETTCSYSDQNNDIKAEFTYDLKDDSKAQVSSKLSLNGVEIPAQKDHCLERSVPGRRGYLCSHRSPNGEVYDLYPQYEIPEGKLVKASMIVWGETDATTIEFSSCK